MPEVRQLLLNKSMTLNAKLMFITKLLEKFPSTDRLNQIFQKLKMGATVENEWYDVSNDVEKKISEFPNRISKNGVVKIKESEKKICNRTMTIRGILSTLKGVLEETIQYGTPDKKEKKI